MVSYIALPTGLKLMKDTPELFWSEASLYPLYEAIREYLEIGPRVQVLNDRLAVAGDLVSWDATPAREEYEEGRKSNCSSKSSTNMSQNEVQTASHGSSSGSSSWLVWSNLCVSYSLRVLRKAIMGSRLITREKSSRGYYSTKSRERRASFCWSRRVRRLWGFDRL